MYIFTGRLITGGRDGRLRIWNYNNGHCLRTLEKGKISTLARTEREYLREKSALRYLLQNHALLLLSRNQTVFDDNPFKLLKIDSLFEKLNTSLCVSEFR